jgi:hypothetical protein
VRAADVIGRRAGGALRFVLRKLLWIVFSILRLAWRHPALTLLLAIVAYLGYQQVQAYFAPPPSTAPPPAIQAAPLIQPPESVQQYLEGQRNFDAEAMWDAFSEETKAVHLAEGSSLSTFKRAIERMRESGLRYGDSQYIGGYRLENGLSYYFYVTEVRNDAGQSAQVYQIFIVDKEGKVIEVDTPQLQQ